MGKIYVTGANGFIGKHLMRALPEAIAVEPEDAYCREKDDTVIHLANRVARNFADYKANVDSIEPMLSKSVSGSRIIYVSSSVVEINNPSFYRASKLACEELCKCYGDRLQISIVRPFNVYGPGQPDGFVIPSIINQFLNGKDIIFVDNVEARRTFVYIDDVVREIINMRLSFSRVGYWDARIAEIIEIVADLFGRKGQYRVSTMVSPVDWGPNNHGCSYIVPADFVSLRQGLAKTVEYYKQLRVEKVANE